MIAKKTFTDQLGTKRKNGEQYLITLDEMESFIPDVYEEVVTAVQITTITDRQYCVILNPIGTVILFRESVINNLIRDILVIF